MSGIDDKTEDEGRQLDELIERFVDDRESLDEREWEALAKGLHDAPERAVELKQQLCLDELVAQATSVDRKGFVSQIDQRVADHHRGEKELLQQVSDVRQLAAADYERQGERALRTRRLRLWAATAACALAFCGIGYYVWTLPYAELAEVVSVEGDVEFVRDGKAEPLVAEAGLRRGDRIRASRDGLVVLRYPDGTIVDVGGDSVVEIQIDDAGGKRVQIERGEIAARVAKQPRDAPMVFGSPTTESTVLGTELYLRVEPNDVRLDVMEGAIEFAGDNRAKEIVQAGHTGRALPDSLRAATTIWPPEERGLVFQFRTKDKNGRIDAAACGPPRNCAVHARIAARLNHDFAMDLGGGSFITTDVCSQAVSDCCRKTGEFSLEATIAARRLDQTGPARIVTLSSGPGERNFSLVQEGDAIVLLLKTNDTGKDGKAKAQLCRLKDTAKHHLAVAYRSGRLVAHLDGVRVFESDAIRGSLENWTRQELVFGDEPTGGRDWHGTLEGVAIYSRFVSPLEVRRNAGHYRGLIAARPPVPQIEIVAELYRRSEAQSPEEFLPKKNALVTSKYKVKKVLRGKYRHDEIIVMEWSILDGDGQPINAATAGDEFRLVLEHVNDNPQLGAVTCFDSLDDKIDGVKPRYYSVRP